jgi:hypothetical protein
MKSTGIQDTLNVPLVGRPAYPVVLAVHTVSTDRDVEEAMKWLEPMSEAEDFKVTIFAPPSRVEPVPRPWLQFGAYGWEGCRYEAAAWTDEEARDFMLEASQRGYSKVFMPPDGVWDIDVAAGLREAGALLMHHENENPLLASLVAYPGPRLQRAAVPKHLFVHSSALNLNIHPGFTTRAQVRYQRYWWPREAALEVGEVK